MGLAVSHEGAQALPPDGHAFIKELSQAREHCVTHL